MRLSLDGKDQKSDNTAKLGYQIGVVLHGQWPSDWPNCLWMGLTVTWKNKKLVMKQLVLNEGCSIDMACFMTAVQSFCDFKTMLKKQDVRVVPPSLHRYCSDHHFTPNQVLKRTAVVLLLGATTGTRSATPPCFSIVEAEPVRQISLKGN